MTIATDSYKDFTTLAEAALQMTADKDGVELSSGDRAELLERMTTLDPHSDAGPALARLRGEGVRLAALTNGTLKSLRAQLKHAGLEEFFEELFSVDEVQRYIAAYPAQAQQRDPAPRDTTPVVLPEIVVTGSILPTVGPAVRSGVPARVEVSRGDELRAGRPRVLSDALAGRSGISLYDDLGSPFKTTLVMRGFAASPVVGLPQGVTVFPDGVPVNEPDAGQANFDLLPLEHVERVELLSGTASLLGPNSLGGGVNLVTRRGGDGVEGEASLGSFGRWGAGRWGCGSAWAARCTARPSASWRSGSTRA